MNEQVNQSAEEIVPESQAADQMVGDTVALEAQIQQLKEQLLYAMAETENLRKRHIKEKEETAKFAVSNFSRDILTVADNLDLAISNSAQEDIAQSFNALKSGIELTAKELQTVLEKHNIRKIVPHGEAFDHNFHQAIAEVPESGQAPGTVVQVVQAK
jgi:molecular chaperone GrpE